MLIHICLLLITKRYQNVNYIINYLHILLNIKLIYQFHYFKRIFRTNVSRYTTNILVLKLWNPLKLYTSFPSFIISFPGTYETSSLLWFLLVWHESSSNSRYLTPKQTARHYVGIEPTEVTRRSRFDSDNFFLLFILF